MNSKDNSKKTNNLKGNGSRGLGSDSAKGTPETTPLPNLQDMSRRTGNGVEDLDELEGVKDMEAYRKWRSLRSLPILNEKSMIEASNGTTINLGWFPSYLEPRIEMLPPSEREAILNKKEIYNKMHLLANKFKLKAYGTNPVKKAQERAAGRAKELGFLKAKKSQLIELFGRMFSTEEVHKHIVETWKFPIALNDVIDFRRNNIAIISEKQEIHKREHSDLRLVHKRSRLEELTYLYNRLKDKTNAVPNREDFKAMTAILVEIRKEIEGEKFTINGRLDVNIEADINVHLQKEVFKEFSLTQIILGRVASRMNVHSARLIQGLNNSYYARYNRFLGNEPEDVDFEEIDYPSNYGYDFEKIKGKYREKEIAYNKQKNDLKQSESETELRVVKMGLKEALLAKLTEKTGEVKAAKLEIDTAELDKKLQSSEEKKKFLKKKPKED